MLALFIVIVIIVVRLSMTMMMMVMVAVVVIAIVVVVVAVVVVVIVVVVLALWSDASKVKNLGHEGLDKMRTKARIFFVGDDLVEDGRVGAGSDLDLVQTL